MKYEQPVDMLTVIRYSACMPRVSKTTESQINQFRDLKIVKSNELIQKSRFHLSLQEQKIIFYLVSKIKPGDPDLKEYTFEISDFCRVCGLNKDSGANYENIRTAIKTLRDRSVWLKLDDGAETILSWIDTATVSKRSGSITVKISDLMKPYLLALKERFTQFELLYTLAMRSQYSLRLYEIFKSYEYKGGKKFEIDELKKLLSSVEEYERFYPRFPDFQRNVIDRALKEINELSDITVSYTIEKEGRRYARLNFTILVKTEIQQRMETWERIERFLAT